MLLLRDPRGGADLATFARRASRHAEAVIRVVVAGSTAVAIPVTTAGAIR